MCAWAIFLLENNWLCFRNVEPSEWSWGVAPTPECLTDDVLPFGEPHSSEAAGSQWLAARRCCLWLLAWKLTAFQLDLSTFQSLFGKGTKQKMSRKKELKAHFGKWVGILLGQLCATDGAVVRWAGGSLRCSPSAGVKVLELSSEAPAEASRGRSPLGRFLCKVWSMRRGRVITKWLDGLFL